MWMLGSSLFALLIVGVPIGIALAGATALIVSVDPFLTYSTLFKAFFSFISKYTLIAIPFFIYAGFLMERTGLVGGLFKFADALIGWVPGGFAYATLIAAVLFGAISGSSTAMAAAMSVIAYPELIKRGYPKWMAAGVIASAGGIALLIPPSITLILFGVITEESIVSLFFAGVIPGIMLALSDAFIIVGVSLLIKLPRGKFEVRAVGRTFLEAWPALLMPVVVLGGLYGGVFTPTEAGAAAAGYALVYGLIAKGKAFLFELIPTTIRTMNLTAIVFFLLGCVGVFQFFLANMGWPQDIADWVNSLGLSPIGFLFVLMGTLLVLSMFLTGVAILVLTVPIFFPVALSLGIDPIHLGILTALAIEIGSVIPPVGLNLFAVSGVTGLPVTQVIRGSFPFCCSDTVVLIIVLLFPTLALWLPSLLQKSYF
ncbi:MAG: TRAP transporter large permease [Arenicellales bacterium]|jgi:C4-dicarboxylate transporter DctM subunit|nr:TRAP transporter large permease [Arenicellales bacterium]MDP6734583.1 TRAP transporter large permease [Gammaproteobacteria bacterium]MDP7452994.1 TRAP transporter large permease [Arenicellales bacterium]MDP7617479.1 TRAP transporter large permease [Arenicellales bacterium]HJL52707.1 TRAP transporter large permease [Arenicellales bacterium]|tara:strand:+ start:2365 stop:3645 length:1281 start_codon:yes stop_codon:yes gene_type:complete